MPLLIIVCLHYKNQQRNFSAFYYEGNKGKKMKYAQSFLSPKMHALLMENSNLKNLMEEKEIYQIGLQLWILKK